MYKSFAKKLKFMKFMIPNFLCDFKFKEFTYVEICNLYVGLLSNKNIVNYVKIKNTPHYKYAQSYIFDTSDKNEHKKNYINYLKIQSAEHTIEKFEDLINNMKENGYNSERSPILVWRHWSRPLPLKRLDVADGFHRLAILSALGYSNISVAILIRKENIFKRIINKFKK